MNRRLIRQRCEAAGLRVHDAAKRVGFDPIALLAFPENPHQDARLPFGVLRALSRLLDIDLNDLVEAPTPSDVEHEDEVRIEAALATFPEGLTRDDLAQAFGWSLDRVERGIAALERRLRATGRRIRRVGWHVYMISPNLSVLSTQEGAALARALGRRRGEVGLRSIEILYKVLCGWCQEAYYAGDPDSVRILRELRLIETRRGEMDFTADVVFSLRLDE